MSSRSRKVIARPDEINRVSIALYQRHFQGVQEQEYRPREGTLIFKLWRAKRLELHQQRAWQAFVSDLYASLGESGKVTASYEQAVQVSGNKQWRASTNKEYDRLQKLSDEYLDRRKQRPLLLALILDEIQTQGVVDLERIGFHFNGYKDTAQAHSSGVANVCALLDAMARFYEV